MATKTRKVNRKKTAQRKRRHKHLRRKVEGTPERPRLNVYRSLKHMYAQVIDDTKGETLLAVSTLSPEVQSAVDYTGNTDAAAKVGEVLAEKCLEAGIEKVVFDRGGFKYHGRVKALADAARTKLDF